MGPRMLGCVPVAKVLFFAAGELGRKEGRKESIGTKKGILKQIKACPLL